MLVSEWNFIEANELTHISFTIKADFIPFLSLAAETIPATPMAQEGKRNLNKSDLREI